jgi:predicted small lipoprotein YifL
LKNIDGNLANVAPNTNHPHGEFLGNFRTSRAVATFLKFADRDGRPSTHEPTVGTHIRRNEVMSRIALALVLSTLSLAACGQYGALGQGPMAGTASVAGDPGTHALQAREQAATTERATREPTRQQRDIRDLAIHARENVTCRQCR